MCTQNQIHCLRRKEALRLRLMHPGRKQGPRRGINHNVKHLYQQNKLWNSTYIRWLGMEERRKTTWVTCVLLRTMGCHHAPGTTSFNAFLIYYTSSSISFLPYNQGISCDNYLSSPFSFSLTVSLPTHNFPASASLRFSCEWNIV